MAIMEWGLLFLCLRHKLEYNEKRGVSKITPGSPEIMNRRKENIPTSTLQLLNTIHSKILQSEEN